MVVGEGLVWMRRPGYSVCGMCLRHLVNGPSGSKLFAE
jgi:hypothetical protein